MKSVLAVVMLCLAGGSAFAQPSPKPWKGQPQTIPGKVECELYDECGEGVAYHDTDAANQGSGTLNPADGNPLNEFRLHEGVDISYTKANGVDDTEYDKVQPLIGSLYVGWTEPGEWLVYTVDVKEAGNYDVSLMYTSNRGGSIAIDVDGQPAVKEAVIVSTQDPRDPVPWRQWHHWNRADHLAKIPLTKGTHLLKLRVLTNGNMNFDYLEFKKE